MQPILLNPESVDGIRRATPAADAVVSNDSASALPADSIQSPPTREDGSVTLKLVPPAVPRADDGHISGTRILTRFVRGDSYSPAELDETLRILARFARSPSAELVLAVAQIAEAIGTKALLRAICVASEKCVNLLPYVLADTFLLTKTSQLVLETSVDGLRAPEMKPPPGASAYWSNSTEPFDLARQFRTSPKFYHPGACSRIVSEPRRMPKASISTTQLSIVFALGRALDKTLRAIHHLHEQSSDCSRAVCAFDVVVSQLNVIALRNRRVALGVSQVAELSAAFSEIEASISMRRELIREAHRQLSAVAKLYCSRKFGKSGLIEPA